MYQFIQENFFYRIVQQTYGSKSTLLHVVMLQEELPQLQKLVSEENEKSASSSISNTSMVGKKNAHSYMERITIIQIEAKRSTSYIYMKDKVVDQLKFIYINGKAYKLR